MLLARCVARTLAPVVAATLGVATLAGAQILDAPDPAQMEDAPDLGYRAVPHGLHRRSQAGPAGADNGQIHSLPSACTRQASQSLRSGVRLMRWCSTWKLSRSISRSRVR